MDSIYSIVHITIPSRYEKIMEDGYLCPFRSVHGTGVFCFIQKKKNQWKEITNFRWFGNCAVEQIKNSKSFLSLESLKTLSLRLN